MAGWCSGRPGETPGGRALFRPWHARAKEPALTTPRPHRPAYLSPDALDAVAATDGISEAELLSRLEDALAALPAAEREAVVTALGYGEGSARVAHEQGLTEDQAEALTRSGLQLLRGALSDCDADALEVYARGQRRRTRQPRAE